MEEKKKGEAPPSGPGPLRRFVVTAFFVVAAFGAGYGAARLPRIYQLVLVRRTVDLGPERRERAAERLFASTTREVNGALGALVDHYLAEACDADPERRQAAEDRLVELLTLPQPRLEAALGGPDPALRDAAIAAILAAREVDAIPPERLIPYLVDRLASHEYRTYFSAYEQLRALGDRPIPALREALSDPRNLLQRVAVASLLAMDRDKEGVGPLIELLGVTERVGLDNERLDRPASDVAAEKLRYVTGRPLDLPDDPDDRRDLVDAWRAWWHEERATFRFAHEPAVR